MENSLKINSAIFKVFNTHDEFIYGCTGYVAELISKCISTNGKCTIALSGGSTPSSIYHNLSKDEYSSRINWNKVFLFWGDERCVPPQNPESNYRMVNEELISKVPIPSSNVYRIHSEKPPIEAAEDYENTLRNFFGGDKIPSFDIVLLGLGEEGHTASLFPGSSALKEEQKWVASICIEKLNAYRITLTLPVINNARHILFIVSGSSKAEIVKRVFTEDAGYLPARMVNPKQGELIWLLDKEAASLLNYK